MYGQPPPQQLPQGQAPFDPSQRYRVNVFIPPNATHGPVPSPALRKWELACGIVQIVMLFVGVAFYVAGMVVRGEDGLVLVIAGACALIVFYLVLIAYGVISAVWLYKIWKWFPPEQRTSKLWSGYISPGTAVGFLFIPYFNIYWMFVVYLGIADILERMQVTYPTTKPAPKTLALLTLLLPFAFFPIGPFMRFFFARHVESMAREMDARMGRPLTA
jgi:hypothetical protein